MAKGKRGGKNGGKSQNPQPVPPADLSTNAQNVHDLAEYLRRNYGARLDESTLSNMDYKTLWTQVEGIEEAYRAFPELKPLMKSDSGVDMLGTGNRVGSVNRLRVTGTRTGNNVYASMSPRGTLNIGGAIRKHKNIDSLIKGYDRDVMSGFHPRGTNASHISSHELGHMMVMLVKNAEGGGYSGKHWGSDTANSIVRNAWQSPEMKTIRATYKKSHGYNLDIKSARNHISRYAGSNNHETIAEAVAQYSAVGENASSFSKAIVKELKSRMVNATRINNGANIAP